VASCCRWNGAHSRSSLRELSPLHCAVAVCENRLRAMKLLIVRGISRTGRGCLADSNTHTPVRSHNSIAQRIEMELTHAGELPCGFIHNLHERPGKRRSGYYTACRERLLCSSRHRRADFPLAGFGGRVEHGDLANASSYERHTGQSIGPKWSTGSIS